MKLSDRIGEQVHSIVFNVWFEVLIVFISLAALIFERSPWFIFLTLMNVYQLWMIAPLGWGDRSNDRKLDEIIKLLEKK